MQNRVESLRRIKEPISKAYPKPQTASCKISSKLGSGGSPPPPPPPPNGVQFAGFCLWFSLPLHDGHCQQGQARTSQPARTKPSAPQHHPTMGCICTTCQPFTHNHHQAIRVHPNNLLVTTNKQRHHPTRGCILGCSDFDFFSHFEV
jgi:hypothetical protein